MALNYNRAAWFYDTLSRVVFGNAVKDAQTLYLPFINTGDSVLIVGGGTGWILEWLTKLYPKGLSITYVEASAAMIKKAKKKFIDQNDVLFINNYIEEFTGRTSFDVVITPFLFDNFLDQESEHIFNHINKYLKLNGLWLYSDFRQPQKIWQSGMLKIMLLFFKLLCKVEANKLPDIENLFRKHNYKLREEGSFYKGFIISRVYANSSYDEAF
jgi:ubiquinone/menaquinone biosynthesis C-methylase UbiE